MVAGPIQQVIHAYLNAAEDAGIPVHKAILFGSQARGDANEYSDIDLVIVSPALEPPRAQSLIATLWGLRVNTDSRIEPVACGEREWETDDTRIILEVARREGVIVPLSSK